MKDDLAKMRQASAQAMASRKMLENKYEAAKRASEDWYRKQGEEDLAREALKRRISLADNASSLRSQLDQQKGAFDSLVSNTKILESKIHEAMSKKDTLKARARSAKVASEVGEMVGNVDTGSALSAFGMMEEKVLAMEALGQLTMDDVEGKFAVLESSSSVEDDLAKLKKQLSAGRSKKGELPPGRTVAASNKAYLLNDSVIEMGLSELRLKAKVDCL